MTTPPDREQIREQTGIPYDKIAELDARRDGRMLSAYGFLAEALISANVPSIGPNQGAWVVDRLLPALDRMVPPLEALAAEQSEDAAKLLKLLKAYRAAWSLIVHVEAHHQRAVIDGLHRTLRTDHAERVGVQDPDHLETYAALEKLGKLGQP